MAEIILKRKVVFQESSEALWGTNHPWYKFLKQNEINRDKKHGDVDIIIDSYKNLYKSQFWPDYFPFHEFLLRFF